MDGDCRNVAGESSPGEDMYRSIGFFRERFREATLAAKRTRRFPFTMFCNMNSRPLSLSYAIVLLLFAALTGCSTSQPSIPDAASGGQPASSASAPATTQPVSATSGSANNNVAAPNIDGNKSMQYVKEVVAFGSRPPGSRGTSEAGELHRLEAQGRRCRAG